MSRTRIMLLGAVTLVFLVAALLLTGRPPERIGDAGMPLISGLRDQVNRLEAIDITASDGQLIARLRRGQERWVLENREGYEADGQRVQAVLRELALARRAEPRTSRTEGLARIGLADIGNPQASGVLVEFPGTGLPAIILGSRDPVTEARFARLLGEPGSWLSDRSLDVPTDTAAWLARDVMDIPASQLAELTILHPDGDRVRLRPADEAGEQWVLLDVPEGREAGPRWEMRPVVNGLASVVLEDVRRHQDDLPAAAVRAHYLTRDGLHFLVSLFSDEEGQWAHFSVSAGVSVTDASADSEPDRQLLIDAAAVDQRLSAWQFRLPRPKFETMTRRLEQLLAPAMRDDT